jgi:hypothetical protein
MDRTSAHGFSSRVYYLPWRGVRVTNLWLAVGEARYDIAHLAGPFVVRRSRWRARDLWGVYRGRSVLLLSASNRTEVRKIARALERAIQANREMPV